MGLAKTATVSPVSVTVTPPANTATIASAENSFNGLPEQFLYHMGVDYKDLSERGTERLQEIYKWALDKSEEKTLGNALKTIKDLELEMGMPKLGDSMLNKIWRFVHISNQMKDLDLQRKQLGRRF